MGAVQFTWYLTFPALFSGLPSFMCPSVPLLPLPLIPATNSRGLDNECKASLPFL